MYNMSVLAHSPGERLYHKRKHTSYESLYRIITMTQKAKQSYICENSLCIVCVVVVVVVVLPVLS